MRARDEADSEEDERHEQDGRQACEEHQHVVRQDRYEVGLRRVAARLVKPKIRKSRHMSLHKKKRLYLVELEVQSEEAKRRVELPLRTCV